MRLRMFGATDKGLVRSSNQDAYFCSAEYGLVIVSDGMGGHKGGEIASQLTVNGLKDAYLRTSQILVENVGPFLDEVLRKINLEILTIAQNDPNLTGMGATVNYLQFAGGYVAIGHAGDSRTYLVRAFRKSDNRPRYGIWSLTIDHNVGTFVERGLIVPGKNHPPGPLSEKQKSRLMRGMGVVSDLKADLYCKLLAEGDIYLTCSDGLHGFVSDKDIVKALASGPIANAPERLIELAKSAGAPDNVTVVVSIVSDVDEPLRDPLGTVQEKTPYLVRLPSGELRGTFTADEITDAWISSEIPNNAEVCASLNKWVFLNQKDQLLRTYPEFDSPRVRGHFQFTAPDSHLQLSRTAYFKPEHEDQRKKVIVAVVLLILILVLVQCGISEFTRLQRPAY